MKCWNCKEEMGEENSYCPFCGEKHDGEHVDDSSQTQDEGEFRKCPYCDSIVEEDARFCTVCGREIPVEDDPTDDNSGNNGSGGNGTSDEDGGGNSDNGFSFRYKILFGVLGVTALIAVIIWLGVMLKMNKKEKNITEEITAGTINSHTEDDADFIADESYNNDEDETEQEDEAFYEGALDAVHQEQVVVRGTIDVENTILLDEQIDICAYKSDGTQMRMNQVYYVHFSDESFGYADQVGAEVELSGHIEFLDGVPVISVTDVTVLKEAVNEEDIHRYEVFVADCTWEEAYINCLRMGGYLARINSKEEFKYITKQVIEKESDYTKKQYYIGMRRDVNSDAYYLVDENNELFGSRMDGGYTDWANSLWLSNEPSYYDSTLELEETCVTVFKYKETNKWVINDIPSNLVLLVPSYEGKIGYICEFDD